MTFRSAAAHVLEPVIGPSRVRALVRRERRWRRRFADRLDPSRNRKPTRPRKKPPVPRAEPAPAAPAPAPRRGVFPEPTMTRHQLLAGLHAALQPAAYAEVGVHAGYSLALARCRSVAVDPAFDIRTEIRCDVHLVRAPSDEFFAREDPFEHLCGAPVDLAFIDGMHLAEFAYRDLANMERHMARCGVIVLDDMLPRVMEEAARERVTTAWAGDVYKVAPLVRELRPDLVVLPVNTAPTGTVVVIGLDPASTRLHDAYDSVLDRLLAPDPQDVPRQILDRVGAADAAELLASPLWQQLRELRQAGAGQADLAHLLARFRELGNQEPRS